jgi:DNA ligase-1
MITKPLLAATWKNEVLQYPLYATPKIDGIRILKQNGKIISRSFKYIKNKQLSERLNGLLPEGCDGEIFIKDKTISDVTSFVNSINGITDGEIEYYVFDIVTDNPLQGYLQRCKKLPKECVKNGIHIIPLHPVVVTNKEELYNFEDECLSKNFEGIMLRKGDGVYKCGRSTVKEGILLKVKRFSDTEAEIIGFEELNHNENEIKINELNQNFRSSKKIGKKRGGILGAFIVRMSFNNQIVEFKIGSGFTLEQRYQFWKDKDSLLGVLVKFKYFEVGSKNCPRFPIFLCLRNIDNM